MKRLGNPNLASASHTPDLTVTFQAMPIDGTNHRVTAAGDLCN